MPSRCGAFTSAGQTPPPPASPVGGSASRSGVRPGAAPCNRLAPAVGAVAREVAEQMAEGWNELIGTRLKALVERGDRLGIAPDPPNLHTIRTETRND